MCAVHLREHSPVAIMLLRLPMDHVLFSSFCCDFLKLKIIHNRGRKSFREFFIKSHRFYSDCDGLFSHVYASSCSFCTLFCSYSVSDFGLKKYAHADRDNLYKEVQILLPCRFMSSQGVPLFFFSLKKCVFSALQTDPIPRRKLWEKI